MKKEKLEWKVAFWPHKTTNDNKLCVCEKRRLKVAGKMTTQYRKRCK